MYKFIIDWYASATTSCAFLRYRLNPKASKSHSFKKKTVPIVVDAFSNDP